MGRYTVFVTTRFVNTVEAITPEEAIRQVRADGIHSMRVEEEKVSELYSHDEEGVWFEIEEDGVIVQHTDTKRILNERA